jgi:hypothetical protein
MGALMPDAVDGRFFNLKIDVYVPGRWYMSEPATPDGQEVDDIWMFTQGERIEPPGRLLIPLHRPGKPLDYTTAGVGSTPILSERAAKAFSEFAPQDTQLYPVDVEGQAEPYYLLVVAREVRCIDDAACEEVRFFTAEWGLPDRIGEYEVVSGLRIDKSKVGDARVFKLWGWSPALIVAEEVKIAFERDGFTGGYFEEV